MSMKYHSRRMSDLERYAEEKINMLTQEFFIRLTREDIERIRSFKSAIELDKHVHQLLIDRL